MARPAPRKPPAATAGAHSSGQTPVSVPGVTSPLTTAAGRRRRPRGRPARRRRSSGHTRSGPTSYPCSARWPAAARRSNRARAPNSYVSHRERTRNCVIIVPDGRRPDTILNRTREMEHVLGVYLGPFSSPARDGRLRKAVNICSRDKFKYPRTTRMECNDIVRGYVGFAGGSSSSRAR